jgi:hypothetical protein
MNSRFLACAGAALTAIILSTAAASAQPAVVNMPAPRVGHVGMPLYLRVPVGSRAEAAALRADQDAALAAQKPVMTKKKGKGR